MHRILIVLVSVLTLSVTTLAHAISPTLVEAVADRPITLKLESGGKIDGEVLSRDEGTFIVVDTDGDVFELAYDDVQSVHVRVAPAFEEQVVAGGGAAPSEDAPPVVFETRALAGNWTVQEQTSRPEMRYMYVNNEGGDAVLSASRMCGTWREEIVVLWPNAMGGRTNVLAAYDDAERQLLRSEVRGRTNARLLDSARIIDALGSASLYRVTVRNAMKSFDYVFDVRGFDASMQVLRRSCARE